MHGLHLGILALMPKTLPVFDVVPSGYGLDFRGILITLERKTASCTFNLFMNSVGCFFPGINEGC